MEEEIIYKNKIKSNKNHLIFLKIKSKENSLFFDSYFTENYLTTNYIGEFSLSELQKDSNYYKQFNDIKMIIREIEAYTGEEKIKIEENNNKINITFPINSAIFKKLNFTLALKQKSDVEKIKEYEKAFDKFKEDINGLQIYIKKLNDIIIQMENRFIMSGFNSKIIRQTFHKEIIKMWISPFENISSKLLYSFSFDYKNSIDDYETDFNDLEKFHKICDNKSNLLLICSSKNEIFGGYTPLCFLSDNTYGYDNDSFIFSMNNLKKYQKNNQNNDKSIWRYANYGPCFSYDLYFKENTINKVKFENYNYTIPKDFLDKNKSIIDKEDWILLDSIEIFEIIFPN